jgi:hypothetical protein
VAFRKDYSLKCMGLLPSSSIDKLIKKGIKTPALLYYYIQDEPEEVSLILGISKENTLALGTLILHDWIDEKTLKVWIATSLDNTGQPINYFFKRKKTHS